MPNMKGRQWPFGYTFKLQKCANGNAYSTTSRSEDVLGRKMGLYLSFTLPKTDTTSLTYMLNISKKKLFLKYPVARRDVV